MGRTVMIAGATGLVGRHALERLLDDPTWDRVVAYGRRAPPGVAHDKLLVVTGGLAEVEAKLAGTSADDAVCALGTTIKTAGSQEAFRAVDHDGVVAFARAARAAGVERFALVSSVGADARSRVFYSRVKGETEDALRELGFASLTLLRPSILLGDRGERRPLEAIGMALARPTGALMLGPLKVYRGIDAADVAAAAVGALRHGAPGVAVAHYAELLALARR